MEPTTQQQLIQASPDENTKNILSEICSKILGIIVKYIIQPIKNIYYNRSSSTKDQTHSTNLIQPKSEAVWPTETKPCQEPKNPTDYMSVRPLNWSRSSQGRVRYLEGHPQSLFFCKLYPGFLFYWNPTDILQNVDPKLQSTMVPQVASNSQEEERDNVCQSEEDQNLQNSDAVAVLIPIQPTEREIREMYRIMKTNKHFKKQHQEAILELQPTINGEAETGWRPKHNTKSEIDESKQKKVCLPYNKDFSKKKNSQPTYRLIGLQNLGNTCYMNSGLQCLLNLPILRSAFFVGIQAKLDCLNSMELTGAFKELLEITMIENQAKPNQSIIKPYRFKSALDNYSPMFQGYQQQDCSEFLSNLLNGLHEELQIKPETSQVSESLLEDPWEQYQRYNNSIIADLTHGLYQTEMICNSCDHSSSLQEPFLIVLLDGQRLDGEAATIENILLSEEKPQILGHPDQWYCNNCHTFGSSTTLRKLVRLPQILILQIKRLEDRPQIKSSRVNKIKINNELCINEQTYELCSIANHYGTSYSGHYTALCKSEEILDQQKNKWYCCNDSSISALTEDQIFSRANYLLFYQVKQKKETDDPLSL